MLSKNINKSKVKLSITIKSDNRKWQSSFLMKTVKDYKVCFCFPMTSSESKK